MFQNGQSFKVDSLTQFPPNGISKIQNVFLITRLFKKTNNVIGGLCKVVELATPGSREYPSI